ncbi:MAG: hypothetical protein V4543_04935 [Bacteroidota bacterium]
MNLYLKQFFSISASVLCMAVFMLLSSCDNFFGKKTKADFLPIPDYSSRPVAYVPIKPDIKATPAFTNPTHISLGFDNLVYVVDSSLGIYSFDQSGRQLALKSIPGVTYCVQDRNLDLLVLTKFDTTTGSTPQLLNTICRYDLKDTLADNTTTLLSLNYAHLVHRMVYPVFTRETQRFQVPDELKQISLNAIGILSGNRYYVTCSGPERQAFNYTYPNNCIMICNAPKQENNRGSWSPLAVTADNGTYGTDYFNQPFAIATTINPPQSLTLELQAKDDFIFTSLDQNSQLRVQYIQAVKSGEGFINYSLKPLVVGDYSVANGFLYTSNKFVRPLSIAMAGDNSRYIFVADYAKDSLFQFTIDGLEGVKPNAISDPKLIKVSFGSNEKDKGTADFHKLRSVAYAEKILWLADEGPDKVKRITRWKLTTDFN